VLTGGKEFKRRSIPGERKLILRRIVIERLEFEPEVLLEVLEGCHSLERLELDEVDWSGKFSRRIWLPNLTYFSIYKKTPFASTQEIMESIFFSTDNPPDPNLNYTSTAELSIKSKSNDREFILKWRDEKLSIGNFQGDIARYFSYTSPLTLTNTVLDVSSLSPNLTQLDAEKVEVKDGDMSGLKCIPLISLSIQVITSPTQDVDLSHLPARSLQELILTYVNIFSTSVLHFESLVILQLAKTSLNSSHLIVPPNLYILNLVFVDWIDGQEGGSRFVQERKDLVELHFAGLSDFDLGDLTASQDTLEKLTLEVKTIFQSAPLEFPNLRLLVLRGDSSFTSPQLFSRTFNNTEAVEFENFPLPYKLLEGVLETSVRRLKFSGYSREVEWREGLVKLLNLTELQCYREQKTIEIFKSTMGMWRVRHSKSKFRNLDVLGDFEI
jgi:hypothetical protein